MLFAVLFSIIPERTADAFEEIKKIKVPQDVLVKSIFAVFGKHDIMIIYDAANEQVSLDFIADLRKIGGIIDTETFTLLEIHR